MQSAVTTYFVKIEFRLKMGFITPSLSWDKNYFSSYKGINWEYHHYCTWNRFGRPVWILWRHFSQFQCWRSYCTLPLSTCKSHFPVFQLCCNVCVDHWVVLPYCGYRCKGDVIWGTSVVWPRKGIRFLTARNTKLLLCHWGSMNVFRIPMQLVSWWGNKRVVNRRRSHGSIIASRTCIVLETSTQCVNQGPVSRKHL